MILLVMERRRSLDLLPDLEQTPVSSVLLALPETSWQNQSGIFSLEAEEFALLSVGTSMESWQHIAINETTLAHVFIQKHLADQVGSDVAIEELRWAYLILHAYGHWAANDPLGDDGSDLPSSVLFVWPLILARGTPEWDHGVQLRHDKERQIYEVIAPRAMRLGDEVHFVDRRLSDASVLCFRGLQLMGRHRVRLSLNVSSMPRDPASQPILDEFGCGGQPLSLYVTQAKGAEAIDPLFMGCMRMISLARNASKLRRAARIGWLSEWPDTKMIDQRTELAAAELALNALQPVLNRLATNTLEIQRRFGEDSIAMHPTIRVREAETAIFVNLVKAMKELQLVSHNEYLFEALQHESYASKRGT